MSTIQEKHFKLIITSNKLQWENFYKDSSRYDQESDFNSDIFSVWRSAMRIIYIHYHVQKHVTESILKNI